MELYHYWPGEEYDVPLEATPVIVDRRSILYHPPVLKPKEEEQISVPYAYIRGTKIPTHIDRPWGDDVTESGSSIPLAAGSSTTIGKHTGYGWFLTFLLRVDYESIEISIFRDGEQIHPTFTPNTFKNNYGLTEGHHFPKVISYDTKNGEYTVTYDPPSSLHFESSIWVVVNNPDASGHNILEWVQSVIINEV